MIVVTQDFMGMVFQAVQADPVSWIKIIADLGTVGVLGLGGWLFASGRIIPASVADKQVATASEVAKMTATKEFQDAIKCSVKDGFVEAWYQLRDAGAVRRDAP